MTTYANTRKAIFQATDIPTRPSAITLTKKSKTNTKYIYTYNVKEHLLEPKAKQQKLTAEPTATKGVRFPNLLSNPSLQRPKNGGVTVATKPPTKTTAPKFRPLFSSPTSLATKKSMNVENINEQCLPCAGRRTVRTAIHVNAKAAKNPVHPEFGFQKTSIFIKQIYTDLLVLQL
jgi:hypothetical protein